jgi:hypothetical protein
MWRPRANDMTFAQLHYAFQPGLLGFGGGQYLHCSPDKKLYAGYRIGLSQFERDNAVSVVRAAMINQCGPDVAAAVFRKVTAQVQETGRDFRQGVTCGDLELLRQELPRQQQQYRELWNSITVAGPNDRSPRDILGGEVSVTSSRHSLILACSTTSIGNASSRSRSASVPAPRMAGPSSASWRSFKSSRVIPLSRFRALFWLTWRNASCAMSSPSLPARAG